MKQIVCGQCRQVIPMNDALDVQGRQLCQPCAEADLSQRGQQEISEGDVFRHVDPTVCAQCGADNGLNDWPTIAKMPVCDPCEALFRNRPYPVWLKLGFLALLGLAIFCFTSNWRFMAAYREMKQMVRALQASRFDEAAALSESAARHVPEVPELAATANLYRGIALLTNEKYTEAIGPLRSARQGQLHQGPLIDDLLLKAELGAAFDARKFDEFLSKSKEYAAKSPHDPIAVAGVASAYACQYAVSGSDEDYLEATKHLAEASALAKPSDPHFAEYRERIEHRLKTREILTRAEYQRRIHPGEGHKDRP